eukprot:jgi/Botrbrau1/10092/Bobra.0355s0042.1
MDQKPLKLGDAQDKRIRAGQEFPTNSWGATQFPFRSIGSSRTDTTASSQEVYDLEICVSCSDSRQRRYSNYDGKGQNSVSAIKGKRGRCRLMTAEERISRRREGNRQAAQRMRARRIATVLELKERMMALECERQGFIDDLSQLEIRCLRVVEENQWLRSQIGVPGKINLDKGIQESAMSSILGIFAEKRITSQAMDMPKPAANLMLPTPCHDQASPGAPGLQLVPIASGTPDVQELARPPVASSCPTSSHQYAPLGTARSDMRYMPCSDSSSRRWCGLKTCSTLTPKADGVSLGPTPAVPVRASCDNGGLFSSPPSHSSPIKSTTWDMPSLELGWDHLPLANWLSH